MDVDLILSSFNREKAEYILIGGMNFFLVHEPVTTFDVDLWIADTDLNLEAVHSALRTLGAEVSFSPKGDDWKPVAAIRASSWLRRAAVFCLNSPHGPIDIFRHVLGLEEGYVKLNSRCPIRQTPAGVPFRSLSDDLMIQCQLALPEGQRKSDRLSALGFPRKN